MPDDGLLLIERRSVLSAYGVLELANSEHASFRLRSITTRLWWRIGGVIARPASVVELKVASIEPAKAAGHKAPANKAAGATED